jgi:GDP-L-fucose synthase
MSFYRGKRVLVAGGSGFIGSNFVKKLSQLDANITVTIHKRPMQVGPDNLTYLNADLTNLSDATECTKEIDYVIHCAGGISSAGTTVTNPMSVLATNLVVTLRLLEASWINGVKRFLMFSSGTTGYPPYNYAVTEEDFWEDHPAPVYFGYGWSRRYNELISEFVHDKSNMKVAICRPSAPYGRYDNFDIDTGHVIPALISRALNKENPYIVWGTGDELRDFLHVNDLVNGCLTLLEKNVDCDPTNIARGASTTIKELVNIIVKAAGHDNSEIIFDASKPTTIPIRKISISKAVRELDYKPMVPLVDGITDTVEWYARNL